MDGRSGFKGDSSRKLFTKIYKTQEIVENNDRKSPEEAC